MFFSFSQQNSFMKKLHLTREQRFEIQAYLKMNVRPAGSERIVR